MSADRLIELLWGDDPPLSAANALQVHISALRRALEPDRPPYKLLISDKTGYLLNVRPDQVDYARFEQLVHRGHQALTQGEVAQRRADCSGNRRVERLPASESNKPLLVHREARQREELRLAAEEDRIEAELAVGHHADLVPHLEALVSANPLRERQTG